MNRVPLEQEQEELLAILVEASRAVPRDQRQEFLFIQYAGGRSELAHPGMAATGREQYQAHLGDLQTLHERGLIRLRVERGVYLVDLKPEGTHHYEQMQLRRGQPMTKTVNAARDYLETESFRRRHETSVAKWEEAERLLWSADSPNAPTTIGHLCREAMQLFAGELLQQSGIGGDPDAQKTANRVRSVLDAKVTSEARRKVAVAQIDYWLAVANLTQRQEHGAQREGSPLLWEDSRRVVTQTLMVMYEIDRELQTPGSS